MTENLELREWIAVNVMGLKGVRVAPDSVWPVVHEPTPQQVEDYGRHGVFNDCLPVPKYELTWNDAALVVEAMRAREWIFSMKSYMSNSVYPWGASFAQPFSGVVQMEPGNFAPLAICLAAKAAIEATQ